MKGSNNKIKYYLGVDGGGTKTEFKLVNTNNEIINNIVIKGCNPVDIGIENTLQIIDDGIREVCKNINLDQISAFFGIAGGITGNNSFLIKEHLKKYNFGHVENGSDAQCAVASCLYKNDGICIIMGTGNIVFCQISGVLYRLGGYGYLFDDGGSGYSIGRDGITSALKSEEMNEENSILLGLIKNKTQSKTVISYLSQLYEGGKRFIASFAGCVFEGYTLGDSTSREIIHKNIEYVADYIDFAAKKHFKTNNINVVLTGGIAQNYENTIVGILTTYINNYDKKLNISVANIPPVDGALLLAKGDRIC